MKTEFTGKVKAYASELNPLQTIVEFVLTDFEPNKNKQRIPRSEAENIVSTAKNMPIKINFQNNRVSGHAFSVPIGTLSEVWKDEDAIFARSVIWKDEFPEVDEYLRTSTASGKDVGTSWEILYEQATENEGITDLYGCLVAATTIVDNPAYGNRTRILSIAESLNLMDELEQMREAFSNALYALDVIYAEAMKQEVVRTALEDASVAIERFKELFTQIQTSQAEVEAKNQELVTENNGLKLELEDKLAALNARITELENEKAEAEQAKEQNDLLATRRESLASVGLVLDDEQFGKRREYYLAMSEDNFNSYKDDIAAIARSTIKVPDTLGTDNKRLSPQEIAKQLKEKEGR